METTLAALMGSDSNETYFNATSIDSVFNATLPPTAVIGRLANYRAQPPVWQYALQMVLAVIGLVGNGLSLLVYMRVPGGSIHVLLRVLASCDIGFLLILIHNASVRYVRYVNSYGYNWFVGYVMSLMMWAFPAAATYITIAIAAERLMAVAIPLKARTICTPRRARIAAVIILLACTIGRLPNVVMSIVPKIVLPDGTTTYTITRGPLFSQPIGIYMLLIMAILFDYSPPILMVIFNVAILILLRRQDRKRRDLTETAQEQGKRLADRRLTIMLIALATISIICNAPLTMIRIIPAPRAISLYLQTTFNTLYIIDHCVNFLLYVIINTEFRQKFFELFKAGKSRSNLHRSTSTLATSVSSVTIEKPSNVDAKPDTKMDENKA